MTYVITIGSNLVVRLDRIDAIELRTRNPAKILSAVANATLAMI